jgi:putative spermidine/putrescine transport system substrate-binding protein
MPAKGNAMNDQEAWGNQSTLHCGSNLSRRELLKRLGGAAGVAFRQSAFPAGKKSSATLSLWGTATLDVKEEGWDRFQKISGVRISFEDNKNDPGPIVRKLVEGGHATWRHISGLQGGAEPELARARAILPWDTSRLKNYKKLWRIAQDIEYTMVGGECYGIPTVINADSMIYRPDLAGPVDSYEAIFDPVLAGRTAMEDAWINSVIMTAIYLKENNITKIDKPGNLTETELREVMAFLTQHAKAGQFRRLWDGWGDAVNLIKTGEVFVMTGWEPIAIAAQKGGINVKYAEPREGYECWSNDLLLHPGAKKDGLLEVAHALVDWELGGCYGCLMAMSSGYAVPTDEAVPYAEERPREFNPLAIRKVIDNVKRKFNKERSKTYWQNVRPDNLPNYEEEWKKFRVIANSRRGKVRPLML